MSKKIATLLLVGTMLTACQEDSLSTPKTDVITPPSPTEALKKIDQRLANADKITKASDVKIEFIPFEYTLPAKVRETCMAGTHSSSESVVCPAIKIALVKSIPVWIANVINRHITNDDNPQYLKFRRNLDEFTDEQITSESEMAYSMTITPELLSSHHDVVQVSVFKDVYTGGAHGMQTWSYLLFDMHLQSQITLSDMMATDDSYGELSELVEMAFDEYIIEWSHQVQPEDKRSDKEKIKEYKQMNAFDMTDNVSFNQEGLVFHYNPYHLGSYAQGPIALVVPFEKLQNILRSEYLPNNIQEKI